MKQLFVDTSALYALADRTDPAHERAQRFLDENAVPLLTTNYIFAESLSLLTKRMGKATAIRFGEGLRSSDLVRLFQMTAEYEKAAWEEFIRFRDKKFDFIDSTSFVVMQRQGIDAAFGFDRHYVQRGFQLLP